MLGVGRIGQFSMATILASPYYDQQRLLYWGNQRFSEKKVLLYEDFGKMIRYVYLPYAGLCSRKVMMSELDDFSEPSFTHPLGCCDGCNVMQYCYDFIDDYENNSVLNVLTAWIELNKIRITRLLKRN